MGVTISNRIYRNDFNSSTTNFLCSNVGAWNRLEFDVTTDIKILGSSTETFSTPFTDRIVMMSGKKWKDFGFDSGMSLNVSLTLVNNSTGIVIPVSVNVNIVSIYNDILIHDGSIDLTAWSVIPSNNGSDTIKSVVLSSSTSLDAINLKYGLIKNSDSQNTSLNSIIDGTETEMICSGISAMAINDELPLNMIGMKSGMAIENAKIKYLSISGTSRTYRITIDFIIHGFYGTINELEDFIQPDWFSASETLTDNIIIKFLPQYNNPNVFIQNDISWTAQLGNVGWLNENYNGLQDDFSVVSVNYSIPSGSVNSLIYNQETTVVATISGLSNPSDVLLKLQYGILWATKDNDLFELNNYQYHKNLKMNINGNIGYSGSSILVSNPVDTTLKQGFSIDNARIDVTSVDFQVSGSDIVMTLKVICTNDFQTYLENNPDDRKYLIWLVIGDQVLTVNNSNRVSKKIDFNEFQEYIEPAGPYEYLTSNFISHERNETQIGQCVYQGFVEDDVLYNGRFAVDLLDKLIVEKIDFKVEAIKGTQIYELQRKSINVSQYPTDSAGIQQLNFIDSRGFKYNSGNEKNFINVIRDTTFDDSQFKYYKFQYGFKIRWEDWISRTGVPSDFYLPTSNNGFNNDWYHYDSVSGWNVFLSVYLQGTRNGIDVNYKNVARLVISDYDSNPNILKTTKTYKDNDNTLLTAGIDPLTGKDTGVILENDLTRIEVDYELISGVWSVGEQYGTICIQVWNGAGEMKFRQLSTVVPSESDNPLIPLSGESFCNLSYPSTNTLRLKCLVEPSLLDDAVKYQISSRLGCKIPDEGFVYTTDIFVENTNNVTLIPE